ncbi:MAG: hypothetical protein M3114_07925, partial [Thermoproteota archaeon]|nr:hypothetical protein [Thermoproteota archaeon]
IKEYHEGNTRPNFELLKLIHHPMPLMSYRSSSENERLDVITKQSQKRKPVGEREIFCWL